MTGLDELVRNRRFEEIHEARRQVIEDERSINEALATGKISDGRARRLFQRAVDAYVRELEYLLNSPDLDEQNLYWHSKHIGDIPLPGDRNRAVNGLGDYLDLPEELAVNVPDLERDHYYQLGQQTSRTVHVQPPWSVLRSAFRTANAATADLGMELDISDEDRTEITDQLLEEVEQWRQTNV